MYGPHSIAALSLVLALTGCSIPTASTGTALTVSAANSSSSGSSTYANLAASIAEDPHFDDGLTWTAADQPRSLTAGECTAARGPGGR